MPYIPQYQRDLLADMHWPAPAPVGELNYVITKIILNYLGPEPDYQLFNSAMGALACVSQELYRRMVAPYEDRKSKENGDVYPRNG